MKTAAKRCIFQQIVDALKLLAANKKYYGDSAQRCQESCGIHWGSSFIYGLLAADVNSARFKSDGYQLLLTVLASGCDLHLYPVSA